MAFDVNPIHRIFEPDDEWKGQKKDMPVVEYTPDRFEELRRSVAPLGPGCSLAHRGFVDYYYAGGDSCKLLLAYSESGQIQGTLGLDRMQFGSNSPEHTIYAFNNFYSLVSHGVAPILRDIFRKDLTLLAFGGTTHTQDIMASFTYTLRVQGVRLYHLNRRYQGRPEESTWRHAAKWAVNRVSGRPLSSYASRLGAHIREQFSVVEEYEFKEDMLPNQSPFGLRFIPTVKYLRWRYDLTLACTRYRLFRILQSGVSVGYVIINDSPKRLMIAQADGLNPEAIAYGGLLSILYVGLADKCPRAVILASSHPTMQRVYEEFGCSASSEDRYFALARRKTPIGPLPPYNSWLINFDWTDNGLRVPFADQTS